MIELLPHQDKQSQGTAVLLPYDDVSMLIVNYSQMLQNTVQWLCVQDVVLFDPALSSDSNTISHIFKSLNVVGIGVNGDHDAFLFCILAEPPVQIKTQRMSI